MKKKRKEKRNLSKNASMTQKHVTAVKLNDMILLIQQSTILLYMTRYNHLYVMTLDTTTKYYDNLDTTTTYTAIYYLIQHALCNMNTKAYRIPIHEQGDHPPAAGGPPPMGIPGAARRTPRHYPRL